MREPKTDTLVTYAGGRELWRERYTDDGDTLVSELTLGSVTALVTITRATRTVRIESGGRVEERTIPEGAIALENGNWQAYAVAAAEHASARDAVPVQVLLPAKGVLVDATITVTPFDEGSRVAVTIGGLEVRATIDRDGRVVHAEVPAQHLEVRRAGEPAPTPAKRPSPSGVAEEVISLARPAAEIRGVLSRPTGAARTSRALPVVVVIAGSGPSDRDGNSVAGVDADTYRMLATELAARGIATLRFDKRGVGESSCDLPEEKVTIGDFAGDVGALVDLLRARDDVASITLAGHSEGGLLALLAAREHPVDAVVLLATPGRPLGAVLREQLARQLDEGDLRRVDVALDAIRNGVPPSDLPAGTARLFRASVLPFLRSLLDVDPAALARDAAPPITIVQGDVDVQVSVEDAKHLAAARPDATLVVLPSASHMLKDEPSRTPPQASYTDPSRPLARGLVDAIARAAQKGCAVTRRG